MKIVVLCGGTSTERDVSITSGRKVAKALKANNHEVALVDVYLGIEKEILGFESGDFVDAAITGVNGLAPDITKIIEKRKNKELGFFGPQVIKICQEADIVFMALHGENGENGKVQAAFDLLNIKYTGSGYDGSQMAMQKDITRKILSASNIPVAEGIAYNSAEAILFKEDILDKVGLPCVIKPVEGGSSVGVIIAQTEVELVHGLENAKFYDESVLIERYIAGREFSVGVIDGKALPIIEIIPKSGFYDYKNKYQAGYTEEVCPASLDANTSSVMQEMAERVYKALNLTVYARIDFILDKYTNIPYCLEANTLPGMTETSLLPQEAKAVGIDYPELCQKIIEISLKKYN